MKAVRVACWAVAPALAGCFPPVRDALLYDRTAILRGEWWRLWTGHWIHFSAAHFFWNAAVLLVAGTWLEKLRTGSLACFLLLAAPLISVACLVGAPEMAVYGGLSGLATGVVVLLCLGQLQRPSTPRAGWAGVLVLVAVKLGFDAVASAPLFASYGTHAVLTSSWAHVMGAVGGALFFLSPAGPSPVGLIPALRPASRS